MLCALYRKELAGDLKLGKTEKVYGKFLADAKAGRIVLLPYSDDVVAAAQKLAQLAFDPILFS